MQFANVRSSPAALARVLAWNILAVRLAFFDVLEILRARSINDYGSFHAAALAIAGGADPYSVTRLGAAGVHPYFYPPLLAELLWPLTLLEPFTARVVWMALTLASYAGSMLLLDRWLRQRTWSS